MRIVFLLFAFQAFALALTAQSNAPCKNITIVGPAGITMRGDSMILKVKSSTPLPTNTTFVWKVSSGTIVSGQGSGTITVDAASVSEPAVIATVKVNGLQPPCDEIVSEAYGISSPIIDPILDQWGKLGRNDLKARLQNAANQLSKNPGDVLVLLISIAPNGSVTEAKSRERFIRNFFAHDKIVMSKDLYVRPDRLRVVFGRGESSHTSVYILPRSVFETLKCAKLPEDLKPIENPQ